MFFWAIIIILAGCLIALVIYYQEKNREKIGEIKRLRQNMISTGYDFEQLEFNLEQIKEDVSILREREDVDHIHESAKKIEAKIEEILKNLSSGSRL